MSERFFLPRARVFTDEGLVGAGYKLYFYETGTTTPKDSYSDDALTIANSNPVVADANGRFGDIFLTTANEYKCVLNTDLDVLVWTADPINSFSEDLNDFDPRPFTHWGTTSGDATNYTATPDPAIAAYVNTYVFSLQIHIDCNASPTLAIADLNNPGSFLSTKNLKKYDASGGKLFLSAGDLQANESYIIRYDGTDFVVFNPESPYFIDINALGNVQIDKKLNTQKNLQTISSGSISYTGEFMQIDGEGAAPDTLTNITGGAEGDKLELRIQDTFNAVTVESESGNIFLENGRDVVIADLRDSLTLRYIDGGWKGVGRQLDTDFFNSGTTNGYTYLPNGLIMQWGETTSYSDISTGSTTVTTFPITFPNATFQVIATTKWTTSVGYDCFFVIDNGTITTSQFGVIWTEIGTTVQSVKVTFWAIGN
jgi:hypothetical protein